MANKVIPFVSVSDIHAYNDDNTSRIDDQWFRAVKDMIALIASLVHKGFDVAQGIIGAAELLDADKRKLSATERNARILTLSEYKDLEIPLIGATEKPTHVVITGAEIEKEARRWWCSSNGKAKQAKYDVVFGFRRMWCVVIANAVLRKLDRPVIESIPINVLTFESKLERELTNVRENTDKATGLLRQSVKDTVFAVSRLFGEGASESDLSKIGLKRGMCQKYHRLCTLNVQYPSLKLVERCLRDDEAEGYIDVKGLHKEENLQKAIKEATTAEAVEAIVLSKGNNEPPMANKKDIKGLTQNPVWAVRWVAKAIMANDVGRLSSFNAKADDFNTLTDEFAKLVGEA